MKGAEPQEAADRPPVGQSGYRCVACTLALQALTELGMFVVRALAPGPTPEGRLWRITAGLLAADAPPPAPLAEACAIVLALAEGTWCVLIEAIADGDLPAEPPTLQAHLAAARTQHPTGVVCFVRLSVGTTCVLLGVRPLLVGRVLMLLSTAPGGANA